MKKVIGISLLALIILVFGVLPGLMGILAKQAITEALNNNLSNNLVTLQLVSYQRHWFTSDIVYSVNAETWLQSSNNTNISTRTSMNMPRGIIVTEKVYHGPIIFTKNLAQSWRIYLGQAVAKGTIVPNPSNTSFQSFFPNIQINAAGQFQTLTMVGLFGRLHVKINIPALTLTPINTTRVWHIAATNINASADRHFKSFGFGFNIPSITLMSQGRMLGSLNAWTLNTQLYKSPQQLLLGTVNMAIADINANSASGRHLELQNLNVNAQSDIRNKLLDSNSQVNFARLTVDSRQFGPGTVNVSFKRFDPKAQADLAKLSSYSPTSPLAQAAMVQTASHLLSKLISHGAQIIVNPVNVKTSDGDVNLSLSIAFPNTKGKKLMLPLQIRNAVASFQVSLPKLLAHRMIDASNRRQIQIQIAAGMTPATSTNIDAFLVAQRTNQVNRWLTQGLVISQGNDYSFKLNYKRGQVTINNKPISQVFGGQGSQMTSSLANPAALANFSVPNQTPPAPTQIPVPSTATTVQAPVSAIPAPTNATNAQNTPVSPTVNQAVSTAVTATTGQQTPASAPVKTPTTPAATVQNQATSTSLPNNQPTTLVSKPPVNTGTTPSTVQ